MLSQRGWIAILVLTLTPLAAWAKISTSSMNFANVSDPEKHPYMLIVTTSAARGLNYYDDVWNLETGVNIGWNFKNGNQLTAGLNFKSILFEENNGAAFSTYDAHPENYGPDDLSIGYRIPNTFSSGLMTMSSEYSIFLPTSTIARRASLLAGATAGYNFDLAISDSFTITPSLDFTVRQYRYDDADIAGTVINSPFAANYGLGIAYSPLKGLILSSGYSQTQRYNYQSTWTVIQTASAAIQGRLTDNFKMILGYKWKDKTFSNEPALAYDNSEFSVGLQATVQ